MKKFLSVLFLSSALVLTGCSDSADTPEETPEDTQEDVQEDAATETTEGLQDGSYRIEDLNFGETGWKEALEITVIDGEITEATWESKDEEGNDKIDDEEYQELVTKSYMLIDKIVAMRDELLKNSNNFLMYLKTDEELDKTVEKVYVYSYLYFYQDMNDAKGKIYKDSADKLMEEMNIKLSFIRA